MPRAKTATVDLKVRMKEPLRSRIEGAAKKRGVSLNAEVVTRLEESFRKEERETRLAAHTAGGIYASFGRLHTFLILRLLASAISVIENRAKTSWENDLNTFKTVEEACRTILRVFRPKSGATKAPELFARGVVATESAHLGADIAKKVVSDWLEQTLLIDALQDTARRSRSLQIKRGDRPSEKA